MSGTCGSRLPFSPSLVGNVLFWADDQLPCSVTRSYFYSYNPPEDRSQHTALSGGAILSMARDGAVTYWIRDDLPKPPDDPQWLPSWSDCITNPTVCTLLRSSVYPPS